VFMTGVMAYVSAPLWLLSLALSSAFVVLHAVIGPQYFVQPRQLFPIWPRWDAQATLMFALATGAVLFLPKVLGAILVLARGADRFGGAVGVTLSLLMELLLSAALAPVRMLFHTQSVVAALTGLTLHWKSPPREDAETSWGEAAVRHGPHTLLGLAWGAVLYWLAPSYTWWLLPVAGALVVSIPISVYSSRISLGRALRRAGLFVIPDEADPPRELRTVRAHAGGAGRPTPGFVDAVVDPALNAVACAALPRRGRSAGRGAARRTIATAIGRGPDALSDGQKRLVLMDPLVLAQLHRHVSTSLAVHPAWRAARAPETSFPRGLDSTCRGARS
jgi:membrane glycosyltransferase